MSKDPKKIKKKYVKQWTKLYNEQILNRIEKRKRLEGLGINPYKNGFTPSINLNALRKKYEGFSKEELEAKIEAGEKETFKISARAVLARSFGKAGFFTLDDGTDRFQLYVRKGDVPNEQFSEFKVAEYGDILYAEGFVFRTNKGELSLHAETFHILTKSIRPLPEKFHGLTDPELRYRMRYVDMIMNPEVRDTLRLRSQIVRYVREFFYKNDYLEVETPMLHSIAGGAAAKPFATHHNALDLDMNLRIAPELHLKRLVVGGYPRVFELNRCFRNEGLSLKHNPEFTTIEFYQAYATYEDLMNLTENLISGLAKDVIGKEVIEFQGREINLAKPYKRQTLIESIIEHSGLTSDDISSRESMIEALDTKTDFKKEDIKDMSLAKLQVLCFEEFAEANLIQPTFITQYPTEVSPLSRRNDENPDIVDRFEFFMNGWEMANAFSELNNPSDQLERFAEQAVAKEMGDDEACDVDYDYVRALEYGMAPTAGEGIGIDRLTMILTNSPTIRDVILFPQLKKETFFGEKKKDEEAPKSEE